jgi:hypothetical protein
MVYYIIDCSTRDIFMIVNDLQSAILLLDEFYWKGYTNLLYVRPYYDAATYAKKIPYYHSQSRTNNSKIP